MKKLKIGDKLDAFQDGKLARAVTVIVDGIIPRDNLSIRSRRMWKKALKQDFKAVFESCIIYCDGNGGWSKQFWDWNCDAFIVGHLLEPYGGDKEAMRPRFILFAKRQVDAGWYGLNRNYALVVGKKEVK